jgi:hypothetical protein
MSDGKHASGQLARSTATDVCLSLGDPFDPPHARAGVRISLEADRRRLAIRWGLTTM